MLADATTRASVCHDARFAADDFNGSVGGRPFWNSALLAPRFLASAFVSGPAFLIVTMFILRRIAGVPIPDRPIQILVQIVRITIVINLLMVVSEAFTEFYTDSAHVAHAQYLFFGLHGKNALVPWIWTAVVLNVTATILFLHPASMRSMPVVFSACATAFVGVWIEKGMGLITPGFVPSTLHKIVEYTPSLTEWQVTAGVWAFGLMVYTIALKNRRAHSPWRDAIQVRGSLASITRSSVRLFRRRIGCTIVQRRDATWISHPAAWRLGSTDEEDESTAGILTQRRA